MEIKVQCPCGSKYKFDIEPVNGRMPMPVNCPSCGADGTDLANDFLRQLEAPPETTPATSASGQLRIHRQAVPPLIPPAPIPMPPPIRPLTPTAAPKSTSRLNT